MTLKGGLEIGIEMEEIPVRIAMGTEEDGEMTVVSEEEVPPARISIEVAKKATKLERYRDLFLRPCPWLTNFLQASWR